MRSDKSPVSHLSLYSEIKNKNLSSIYRSYRITRVSLSILFSLYILMVGSSWVLIRVQLDLRSALLASRLRVVKSWTSTVNMLHQIEYSKVAKLVLIKDNGQLYHSSIAFFYIQIYLLLINLYFVHYYYPHTYIKCCNCNCNNIIFYNTNCSHIYFIMSTFF